jgi:membrane-bound metal-dependent hydrolase YbcI (DUF457 family)
MMKRTHLLMGLAVTLPFVNWNNATLVPISVVVSFAPDIEHVIGTKERGIMHSMFWLILMTTILLFINYELGFLCFLSYGSHLLLDSFTLKGIPLMYPITKRPFGIRLIKARGSEDMFMALMFLYLIAVAMQ